MKIPGIVILAMWDAAMFTVIGVILLVQRRRERRAAVAAEAAAEREGEMADFGAWEVEMRTGDRAS